MNNERQMLISEIFNSSHEETFSFKRYRVEILGIEEKCGKPCLFALKVDIYEEGVCLIKGATISFWGNVVKGVEVICDVGIAMNQNTLKYHHHFHWFCRIGYSLALKWNNYFRKPESKVMEEFPINSGNIPDFAMEPFVAFNDYKWVHPHGNPTVTWNLPVSAKLDYIPANLMDALNQGIAYQIKDGNIYVWYKSQGGYHRGAAFMLLVGYELSGPPYRGWMDNQIRLKLSKEKKL